MLGFARVCYKVKLAAAMPSSDEIKRLTRSMFEIADKDHGGDISASEFVSWARMHIFGRRLIGVCRDNPCTPQSPHLCLTLALPSSGNHCGCRCFSESPDKSAARYSIVSRTLQ